MAKGYPVCNSHSIASQTETTATIRGGGYFQFGQYYWYGVRVRVYVGGTQVATATGYTTSVNQSTASCSGTRTIDKTHEAQTIQVYAASSSEAVSGYGGLGESGTSTRYTVTIPAKASYTLNYNANGGSNSPSPQTIWHGETTVLSTNLPTREGYNFLGWAGSQSATVPGYLPGATLPAGTNADTTLYAVWAPAYIPPVISNLVAARTSDTSATATVSFTWAIDQTIDPSSTIASANVQYLDNGTWVTVTPSYTPGASGTATASLGDLDIDESYDVRVTVTDSRGYSTVASTAISPAFFTLDFLAGGHGVAFGASSVVPGFDLNMELLTSRSHGTYGQVLTSQGSGNPPTWADQSGGGGSGETGSWRLLAETTSDTLATFDASGCTEIMVTADALRNNVHHYFTMNIPIQELGAAQYKLGGYIGSSAATSGGAWADMTGNSIQGVAVYINETDYTEDTTWKVYGWRGGGGSVDWDDLTNVPTLKTINGESLLGSGNIDTLNAAVNQSECLTFWYGQTV